MYQVVKLYGDFEPWWLLEGWEEDIVMCQTFDNYAQADAYYREEWQSLSKKFPKVEDKSEKMSVFWNPEEQRWCEECDEFLQQYHSLLILENADVVAFPLPKAKGSSRIKACDLKRKAE